MDSAKSTRLETEFLTVTEVAKTLRVSRMTVYRLVEDGKIPAYRFGHIFRIALDDFNAFVERNKKA